MRRSHIAAAALGVLVAARGPAEEITQQPPLSFSLGPVLLRPSGFFDNIAMYRTATTPDGIFTRFGSIPLAESPSQWLDSIAHSRSALEGSLKAGGGRLVGYYESDFLNGVGGPPFRLRQLWGEYERGNWKILAGQAWSLLRPNRAGSSTQSDLMNTIVVEPAYHVGLAGVRKHQVRVTRVIGNWQAVVAYEHKEQGDLVAKLARDSGRLHWEVVGLAGEQRRFAAGLSAVIRASRAVNLVSQQLWSQGAGPDLIGSLPPGVHAHATIHGVEAKVHKNLQLFSYGGIVYGTRSSGNRTVRQWTAGFHQKLFEHAIYGQSFLSFQYSQFDRSLWRGAQGDMNYLMIGFRHFLPARH
ncbi:MAG: hypothetical protein AAB225_11155 [Acidobacteriota bacterium]